MKKLLFVIPTLRQGGAEKALVSLLKCLDPERVSVDLFLFEHGGIFQEEVPAWVNILPEDPVTRAMTLEFRFYWKDLLRIGKFRAAITRLAMKTAPVLRRKLHRPAAFTWRSAAPLIKPIPGTYDAAIGFLEGVTDYFVIDKTTAVRKIGWVHTDFHNKKLLPEEKEYYRRFDSLATITEACRQSLIQAVEIPDERVFLLENITIPSEVLRLSEQPAAFVWEEGLCHILTVARLEYQKGLDLAFNTCKYLVEANAPVCWHVLGDGSMKAQLKEDIRAAGMEKQFILEGVTANPYPYMKAAWAIVQPSRIEGKSIVLDEAKILNKLIITTNYPSVNDQLTDGVNGIITEMTPHAIAEAILRLMADSDLSKRLTRRSARAEDYTHRSLTVFYKLIGLS